jgi:PTH1 family peptidyl-tRNA hydrolase
MFLITCLGNPGKEYQFNRHNAGFLFADFLAKNNSFDDFKKKNNYCFSKGNLFSESVVILKPQTFMNLSGLAVTSAMAFFKIPREKTLVVYDDISLPFGAIRIRQRGSAGGHNGLKNIEKELGTSDYQRVKIGVGAPEVHGTLVNFVLGNFSEEQLKTFNDETFVQIEKSLEWILRGNTAQAMSLFNGKNQSKD